MSSERTAGKTSVRRRPDQLRVGLPQRRAGILGSILDHQPRSRRSRDVRYRGACRSRRCCRRRSQPGRRRVRGVRPLQGRDRAHSRGARRRREGVPPGLVLGRRRNLAHFRGRQRRSSLASVVASLRKRNCPCNVSGLGAVEHLRRCAVGRGRPVGPRRPCCFLIKSLFATSEPSVERSQPRWHRSLCWWARTAPGKRPSWP